MQSTRSAEGAARLLVSLGPRWSHSAAALAAAAFARAISRSDRRSIQRAAGRTARSRRASHPSLNRADPVVEVPFALSGVRARSSLHLSGRPGFICKCGARAVTCCFVNRRFVREASLPRGARAPTRRSPSQSSIGGAASASSGAATFTARGRTTTQSSKVTLNLRPLIRPALKLCWAARLTLLLTATYEK